MIASLLSVAIALQTGGAAPARAPSVTLEFDVADQLAGVPADQRREMLESTLAVIRDRLRALGNTAPTVRSEGDGRIIVELPAMPEQQRREIERILTRPGAVEFLVEAADGPGLDTVALRARLDQYLASLPAEQRTRDLDLRSLTRDLVAAGFTYDWLPLSAHAGSDRNASDHRVEIVWILARRDPSHPLTSRDLERASPGDDHDRLVVALRVKEKSVPFMSQFTRDNLGRDMLIVVDGEVEMRVRIQSPITREAQISTAGDLATGDAQCLIALLDSGPLPLRLGK